MKVSLPLSGVGEFKAAVSYDATAMTMSLNLDGVTSADVPYSGSFGSGDLGIGITARNFERYQETVLADAKTLAAARIAGTLDQTMSLVLSDGTNEITSAMAAGMNSIAVNYDLLQSLMDMHNGSAWVGEQPYTDEFDAGALVVDGDIRDIFSLLLSYDDAKPALEALISGVVAPDVPIGAMVQVGARETLVDLQQGACYKDIDIIEGAMSDTDRYMQSNDDPFSDVTLRFKALDNEPEVQVGVGIDTFTTDATWDDEYLNFTAGQTAVFDSLNNSNDNGVWSCEVKVDSATDIIDGFLSHDGVNFVLSDGTNSTSVIGALDVVHAVAVVFNTTESLMTLFVGDEVSGNIPYTGSLLQGALDLMRTGTAIASIKNVNLYTGNSLVQGKAFVEAGFPDVPVSGPVLELVTHEGEQVTHEGENVTHTTNGS